MPVEFWPVHRFYAPQLTFDGAIELPPDEAHHLARVMRLKTGEEIAVFDGRGREAVARIEEIAGRRVMIRAVEKRAAVSEAAIAITLGQALLKSDKMDRVIRDAVMLGAAAIRPFRSARTEVPRAALASGGRQERWDRTVISSVKQCGRAVVPPVLAVQDFGVLLSAEHDALCLMFVEPGHQGTCSLSGLETRVPAKATILIGPEGGWEGQEVNDAVAAGVTLVTFGQRTLRADAAGAVAIAVLRYIWKDL
jgi:16S rRNA (uracil1498-N3)-methyltransferase